MIFQKYIHEFTRISRMASDTMASVDFRLLEDLRVLTKLVILYFHVRQATQTERNDTNMHVRQATQTDPCVN